MSKIEQMLKNGLVIMNKNLCNFWNYSQNLLSLKENERICLILIEYVL